jgi:hypothetical protein
LALELGEFLNDDVASTLEDSKEAAALARRLLGRRVSAAAPEPKVPLISLLAASVLVALLVGYVLGLSRSALQERPMKAEHLTVIELTDSEERHSTSSAEEHLVARPTGPVAILLTPGYLEPLDLYQVRILGEGGEELERVTLPADHTGTLYLSISGEDLPPSRYLFEIRKANGSEEVLATIPLEISPSGRGD